MNAKLFLLGCIVLVGSTVFSQVGLRRAFQPPGVVNKIPYGANPQFGRYAQTKDAKIYYEVYGKGRPIVLLHGGLFGSTIEYADLIDKLKHHFQVIAISTRGHGKSEIGIEPLTLTQRAKDVLAVINEVTNDSVILIGFSDGGYTAYAVGAMYPNRVQKMVVIGAGALKPGFREFKLTAKMAFAMDSAYWDQQLKLMPAPNRVEEVFSQVAKYYSHLTVSKTLLSKIKCPVMVMAGDKDDGNPVEKVVQAARFIPNHQISIIPNAGHACHNDNFAAAWESITPFLNNPTEEYFSLENHYLEPHQVVYNWKLINQLKVLQIIKDSTVQSVDEPTFVKLMGPNFQNGEIEVKVLSRLLPNAPDFARGFIGIAFRIQKDNKYFESIYLRPSNGRAEQQIRRNHAIQYFSYPNFKFDRLRKESPEVYESYADIGLDEWIKMKISVKGTTAKLYLNGSSEPALVVNDLKNGEAMAGKIGLWVDVGTEGYFRDLKITPY